LKNVLGLRCIDCKKEFPAEAGVYTCPSCGSKGGIMDVIYDYQEINWMTTREQVTQSKDNSIFRYILHSREPLTRIRH